MSLAWRHNYLGGTRGDVIRELLRCAAVILLCLSSVLQSCLPLSSPSLLLAFYNLSMLVPLSVERLCESGREV